MKPIQKEYLQKIAQILELETLHNLNIAKEELTLRYEHKFEIIGERLDKCTG